MAKFPFYKQLDQMDCGPTCLKMISKFYGKTYSKEYFRSICNIERDGVSLAAIAEGAEEIGLQSFPLSADFDTLYEQVPLPCIAYWRQRHFIVVYKVDKKKVYVSDPAYGLTSYKKNEFLAGWENKTNDEGQKEGLLLLLETTPKFYEIEDNKRKKGLGLKFLIPYFSEYKKLFLQIFIGLFVTSLIQLAFPFLTQSIVDKGINYQNLNFIYLVLIAQMALFLSQTFLQYIRSWLLLHITGRMNIKIISDFLIKLMKLPMKTFEAKNIGDIIQRIDDHRRIQNFLSSTSLGVIFSVVNIVVFSLVLLYYNVTIFTVFLIGSSMYVIWVLRFMKIREELDFKRFDQASGNQSSRVQLINGMQEIKLNNSERRRRWEWESIQIKLFNIATKSLKVSQYQGIGGGFIDQTKNILITFLAAKLVVEGEITLGMMLAIQFIIGQLNIPLNNFLNFIQVSQDAKISIERLAEIHDKEDEDSTEKIKTIPNDKSLKVTNLSFRYGGKSSPLVLNKVDLLIPQGKVTAIVGVSGSGKTTFLKLLLKFYESYKGTIDVGNVNLKKIDSTEWRRNCGAVMQDGYIFSDTISRNITESSRHGITDNEKLIAATKIANLTEFVESLPNGYNTKIGTSGMSISGGQKQRILIARAVYKDPEYIFFDEATSALDANNEKKILENLKEFYQGKTVLVIAHRLSTVKNADKIVVFDNQEIVEIGTHEELTQNRGQYYSLVKNQLELGN